MQQCVTAWFYIEIMLGEGVNEVLSEYDGATKAADCQLASCSV
jgi:hypothetical protein